MLLLLLILLKKHQWDTPKSSLLVVVDALDCRVLAVVRWQKNAVMVDDINAVVYAKIVVVAQKLRILLHVLKLLNQSHRHV